MYLLGYVGEVLHIVTGGVKLKQFDGLLSDWKVRDEINCSIDHVQATYEKIEDTLVKLRQMQEDALDEKQEIGKAIEQIVLNR